MMTVGQRIRELRLKKGITQIQLAQGLVTPSMISQIESDRARPSYNVLFTIAERLEVSIEKLLSNVELNLEFTSKRKLAISMCVKTIQRCDSIIGRVAKYDRHSNCQGRFAI